MPAEPKFTPTRGRLITESLAAGSTQRQAAAAAGVSACALRKWLTLAGGGDERYVQFRADYDAASRVNAAKVLEAALERWRVHAERRAALLRALRANDREHSRMSKIHGLASRLRALLDRDAVARKQT